MFQALFGAVFVYLLLISFEIPHVLKSGFGSSGLDDGLLETLEDAFPMTFWLESEEEMGERDAPSRPTEDAFRVSGGSPYRTPQRQMREVKKVSGLVFEDTLFGGNVSKDQVSELHRTAKSAWAVGRELWAEREAGKLESDLETKPKNRSEPCPDSFLLSGSEFESRKRVMVIPCGMTLGFHITVVGTPRWAHSEYEPKIAILNEGDEEVMVSQFMMELQGLKNVEGEDPPRILHFNPRLKGDWSGKLVIEQNTCYRTQWGSALRCEGWKSLADEDTCVEHVGGDMFVSVPKRDAISMKNCYATLPDNGKVILVDIIIPVSPNSSLATKRANDVDMIMLAHHPGGKERTEKEFEALAKGSGYQGFRVIRSAFNANVIEFLKNN